MFNLSNEGQSPVITLFKLLHSYSPPAWCWRSTPWKKFNHPGRFSIRSSSWSMYTATLTSTPWKKFKSKLVIVLLIYGALNNNSIHDVPVFDAQLTLMPSSHYRQPLTSGCNKTAWINIVCQSRDFWGIRQLEDTTAVKKIQINLWEKQSKNKLN